MRILYIAKHDAGGNEDEQAVGFALERLGHEVVRVHERDAPARLDERGHFLLFHHWKDLDVIRRFEMPRVFWTFDLIEYDDPELARRNRVRAGWLRSITETADLGFCTDGDWAAKDRTGKLRWLPQGADERLVGPGRVAKKDIPILMTASREGGAKRKDFIAWMESTYGDRFRLVQNGVHGRALADLIARAEVVLAPEHPVTDRYWSNRLYLTLGFGGFLLHPYSEGVCRHYGPNELATYTDRDDLMLKLDYFLHEGKPVRDRIALQGHARTLAAHLYRNRCETLIEEVKKVL